MTKVDVKKGQWSENLFYKMQLLHEYNRDIYMVFTNWGRIGTSGQFQLTPFENEQKAKEDFEKVFSNKTGNPFSSINGGFEKKKGKY